MKKILGLALVFVMLFCMTAFATTVETGDLLETDIKAFINGAKIDSYNVNGYTAIMAADLTNYGFDVVYSETARTVTILRNDSTEFSGLLLSDDKDVQVGRKIGSAYFTDIRTTVAGVTVLSYNINGKTAIFLDALKLFGKVEFKSELREAHVTIDGLTYKKPLVTITDPDEENNAEENEIVVAPPIDVSGQYYSNGVVPSYEYVTGVKLIKYEEQASNYVSYFYDNFDEFAVDKYVTHLVDAESFEYSKVNQDEVSITYYYKKDNLALAIEVNKNENSVVVTCKK